MDFSNCPTPPPASSPNLVASNNESNSIYSMDLAHSMTTTQSVSDDGMNGMSTSTKTVHHKPTKTVIEKELSDTFDDEYGSDSEYLSSSNQENDDLFHNELDLKLNSQGNIARNIKLLSSKKKRLSTKKGRARIASTSTIETETYLTMPIHESDDGDNFEESLSLSVESKPNMKKAGSANNLRLPKEDAMEHIRSYSESNLHRDIQKNQWPSSDESEDSLVNNIDNDSVKTRYLSMKKKYKKQRRISRQFQDAITVIQDNNEEHIIATEQQLRDQFEREFELRLMELERHKLNDAITNDDKIKSILSQNEELMYQNKQLQQQVAAQVAMIQQQQTMTFVRMQSGDSIIASPVSAIQSPLATLGQFPSTTPCGSTQNILRRVSSASTIPALPIPTYQTNLPSINAATNSNLGLDKSESTNTPSTTEENYTLHLQQNSGSSTDETLKSCSISSGDVDNKDDMINMQPSNKYQGKQNKKNNQNKKMRKKNYGKQRRGRKRKKLKDLETKLLQNDQEMADKVGTTMSPWDRFLELMTPSFCSCSPSQTPQKVVVE